jgi:hypothetical protein
MGKVPEDIQQNMKELAKAKKIDVKELVAKLKEIKETDEAIRAMEKEDWKIRFAWAKLYRQYAVTGSTKEFYVMPLLHPAPLEITTKKGEKMWLGELSALVQPLEEGEDGNKEPGDVLYGAGTFFRDGAKQLSKLEKGKVYKASLAVAETKWGVGISGDNPNFTKANYKFPTTFEKFYNDEIEPNGRDISLGEMDISKSEDQTDVKVVTVTAFDCDVGEREGREYGYYDIMDHSIIGSNIRVFVHPSDVIWAQGSIINMGIRIDIDDKGIPRLSPHFILPTDIAEKREVTVVPVGQKQESVDVGGDEEPKEDEPEESKEEDEAIFDV